MDISFLEKTAKILQEYNQIIVISSNITFNL